MIKIEELEFKNPKFMNNKEYIKLEFEYNGQTNYFIASPNDIESHGKDLYNKAINGDFGEIETEIEVSPHELAIKIAREERNLLLKELDLVVSNPMRWQEFSDTEKKQIYEYRKLLLDLTDQEGFPDIIKWPELPKFIKKETN